MSCLDLFAIMFFRVKYGSAAALANLAQSRNSYFKSLFPGLARLQLFQARRGTLLHGELRKHLRIIRL